MDAKKIISEEQKLQTWGGKLEIIQKKPYKI